MNARFKRYLRRVTVAHAGVLLALLGTASLTPVFRKQEIDIPIMEFEVDVRQKGPESVEVPPEPPKPAPPAPAAVIDPEPAREPPKPPEPPKKKTVEISRVKVTRTIPAPAAKATTLNPLPPDEIKRLLALGAKPGTRTVIPSEEARCFKMIYDAFYEAWAQPNKTEVGEAVTQTRIRLGPDGTILSRSVTDPSGNTVMDSSVRQALNTVVRIEGLSREFVESHPNVTVGFKVQ